MKELLEKLKQAEAPSRELDTEIAKALGVFEPVGDGWKLTSEPDQIWHFYPFGWDNKKGPSKWWSPDDYTSSIDVALSFIPDGWWATITCGPFNQNYGSRVRLQNNNRMTFIDVDHGRMIDPAPCIIAAALKAIAADKRAAGKTQ